MEPSPAILAELSSGRLSEIEAAEFSDPRDVF
jgi:hypothetical protein